MLLFQWVRPGGFGSSEPFCCSGNGLLEPRLLARGQGALRNHGSSNCRWSNCMEHQLMNPTTLIHFGFLRTYAMRWIRRTPISAPHFPGFPPNGTPVPRRAPCARNPKTRTPPGHRPDTLLPWAARRTPAPPRPAGTPPSRTRRPPPVSSLGHGQTRLRLKEWNSKMVPFDQRPCITCSDLLLLINPKVKGWLIWLWLTQMFQNCILAMEPKTKACSLP